jgi:hypothetical protein
MRNKKTKKIGGSRVRTANLLEDVKAAIPLHYTLICTFQIHFNSFVLSICSAKDYMSAQSAPTCPPHHRPRPTPKFFPKKLVPAGIRTRGLVLSSTSLYHYAMFRFASRFETKLYISFNRNT